MLQRLYVHNFKCFENFEFKLDGAPSALLIGKNGTGKSTLGRVLKIFQAIGRGTNRIGQLVKPGDFGMGRSDVPMRFEIEAVVGGSRYRYVLALELPERFRELRILEEQLEIDGVAAYTRQQSLVSLQRKTTVHSEAQFNIDWHLVALPVIQDSSIADPLGAFRLWLARMVILAPIPRHMKADSSEETLEPLEDGSNFADWLSGLLRLYPAAYATVNEHLKAVMPDIAEIRNEPTGKDSKSMRVHFASGSSRFNLSFDDLSDGEKCFFLCAVVLAANRAYGPIFTFWDEPDNFLSLEEVGHFVMDLRRGFQSGGQLLVTSHNEETIRSFSHENTWLLGRNSHLEPTWSRLLKELPDSGDVVQSLISGSLQP